MARTAKARGQKRARRWVSVSAWVVVGGIATYFLAVLLMQLAILPLQALAARGSALPSADAAHARWLNHASAALGLAPAAVYSATYDVCYNENQGWSTSYTKSCHLTYVDFFELPAQNNAVDRAIREAQSSTSGRQTSVTVSVEEYLTAANKAVTNYPDDGPWLMSATVPGASDAGQATDRDTISSDGILGVLVSQRGQSSLDPARQYLTLSDDRSYFDQAIGCPRGFPLNC